MKLCFIAFIGLCIQLGLIQAESPASIVPQEAIYKSTEDYLLPDDHPIKSKLDKLFNRSRVLSSSSSLKKAGFKNTRERRKGLIVTGHSNTPGYLFKIYLETANVDELSLFMKRINGAILIRNALDKNDYNHIMKVPQKWLYAVPEPLGLSAGKFPKRYILVVEDMDIFSDDETRRLYKTIITRDHLEALYTMLTTCLLSDSTWLPNIPFSHDGRIAFIDTEFAGTTQSIWSRLGRMCKNLSSEMRDYWVTLVMERHPHKGILHSEMSKIDLTGIDQASDFEEVDVLSYEFDVKQ